MSNVEGMSLSIKRLFYEHVTLLANHFTESPGCVDHAL